MLIASLPDLHMPGSKPKRRLDNYTKTALDKLRFVLDWCLDNHVRIMLQPGDFFDVASVPTELLREIIRMIRRRQMLTGCNLYGVLGQHDVKFHRLNSMPKTSWGLLEAAGCIKRLTTDPTIISESFGDGISLYGASWGEDLPEPTDGNSVLVAHKMVVDEKLWDAQTGHTHANHLLRRTKFQLISTGDNHTGFTAKYRNKFLSNPGCLLRSTLTQREHEPFFTVYDTDSHNLRTVKIPCLPLEKVMDLTKADEEKEHNAELESFVKGLSEEVSIAFDYRKNIKNTIKANDIEEEVVDIIEEIVNGD